MSLHAHGAVIQFAAFERVTANAEINAFFFEARNLRREGPLVILGFIKQEINAFAVRDYDDFCVWTGAQVIFDVAQGDARQAGIVDVINHLFNRFCGEGLRHGHGPQSEAESKGKADGGEAGFHGRSLGRCG